MVKECILTAQCGIGMQWSIRVFFFTIVYAVFQTTMIMKTPSMIGSGYFDLAFIDHSDQFQECSRPMGSDISNNEGSFMGSNQSLCEELQFQSQVLQPEWLWSYAKYTDLYLFNVTNPELAAQSGQKVSIQELAPLLLTSRSTGNEPAGVVTVNRDDLDTDGRLTYKVLRHWRFRPEVEKHQRTHFSDTVTVPHYIFAAALHNGMSTSDMTSTTARSAYTSAGLPTYYPLFVNVKIGELLGVSRYDSHDPVMQDAADTPFTIDWLDQNPTETSYFVSLKHGLQGFGFIRYAWNGQDIHCGYDADCADTSALASRPKPFQLSKDRAVETSRNCETTQNCQPTSLKRSNNGVQFGVTGFKHLPSASFIEIPEVTGDLWNYKDYSKEGTQWTALNTEHFFLYDVKLDKEARFMRVPTHEWLFSKFHRRTENCEAAGGDSAGFDCDGSSSTLFIGSARDALRPGPLYMSLPETKGPTVENVDMATCGKGNSDVIECQSREASSYRTLTDSLFGYKVCHREGLQVNLKMQKSSAFSNQDTLVPLSWKKEHMCLTGGKLFELMRIYIAIPRLEPTLFAHFGNLIYSLFFTIFSFDRMYRWRNIDMSSHTTDKPCV